MRQPIFHRPRQKTRHAQRPKSRITHSISSISKDVDECQYSIQIIITYIPRINSTYNLRLTCRNLCYHTSIRYGKRIAATRNNKTTKTPGTQRRKHEGIEMWSKALVWREHKSEATTACRSSPIWHQKRTRRLLGNDRFLSSLTYFSSSLSFPLAYHHSQTRHERNHRSLSETNTIKN